MYYVKGNTSRFGFAIQVLPSDIGKYFKLSFITGAIVFISIAIVRISLLYSEITCAIYATFVVQKCLFNYFRIVIVRIKVYLISYSLNHTHCILKTSFSCNTTKILFENFSCFLKMVGKEQKNLY